jgi:integrase/recombinase XerC
MILWGDVLERWSHHLRAAGQSPETIRLRLYHVRRCAREVKVGPAELDTETLTLWLSQPGWTASTRRSVRASLRVFYSWAMSAGIVMTSPAHDLPPVRVPRALPRPAADAAYAAALLRADDRERRALRLAAECGLRRGEVARVRVEDLEPDLAGWSLRVVGKGGHVRLVPVPDDLARDLKGLRGGWVFPSPRGGPLTPAHLGKIVSRRLPDGVATHALRHRAGTRAYQSTRDLRAVQEFLGHAKPETTAIYTEVGREAIRAAMRGAAA